MVNFTTGDKLVLGWIALLAAGIVIGLGWPWIGPLLAKPDAAGWVQAIGSIGALLIAIWVMSAQQKASRILEAERRLNDRLDAVDGVNALLFRLRVFLQRAERPEPQVGDSIFVEPRVQVTWDRYRTDFEPSLRALKNVQPHSFGAAAFFVQAALEEAEAANESITNFLKTQDRLEFSVAHDPHSEKARDRRAGIQGRLGRVAMHGHEIQTLIESIANAARAKRLTPQ